MHYLKIWWFSCFILLLFWGYLLSCLVKSITPPPVHIFLEVYATTPAFLEMIEMVQLPKNEPKFFAFHRFPQRSKLVDLKSINAVEINIKNTEGLYSISVEKFYEILEIYLKKYEKNPLVLYGNREHFFKTYARLLRNIDPKRIKNIHLFEDGFGSSGYHNVKKMTMLTDKNLQDRVKACISGKCKNDWLATIWMYRMYPVTYHIPFKDILISRKDPSFKVFQHFLRNATIKNVSISEIKKNLSKSQIKLLMDMLGFNYIDFIQKTKGRRVGILCSGFLFNQKEINSEITALKQIIADAPKDIIWFLKLHPSYSATKQNKKIRKEFSNLPLIQSQIPLETLLLTNSVDFVAGYRSSLFFATPSENIFKVIGYPNEPIIRGLLSLKKIKENQIIPLPNN